MEEQQPKEEFIRVKTPRGRQALGVVDQRLGSSRMRVRCFDGKSRVCRIPGRLKRKLWIRENDIVLVEPWELDNTKGDVIFKYKQNQIDWLKRKGFLKELDLTNEF
ncbi:MAG: translation initiation factor eIF-1A [Nanoarchaeota archaeon]|nr:translation initiation factor eIF-1A [Nanoarchaeota archaeon]